MTIRISNYQKLDREQLKKMAVLLSEKYEESTESITSADSLEYAVMGLVNYEAELYRKYNDKRVQISETFEEIFKRVGGKLHE